MGQLRYDLTVIRRAYRRCPNGLWATNILLPLFALLCVFLLLTSQAPAKWQRTEFVLERTKISSHRGGVTLWLSAEDGRQFRVSADNQRSAKLEEELPIGGTYQAEYAQERSQLVIQSLADENRIYLHLEDSLAHYQRMQLIQWAMLVLSCGILLVWNGHYIHRHIRIERRRMRKWK